MFDLRIWFIFKIVKWGIWAVYFARLSFLDLTVGEWSYIQQGSGFLRCRQHFELLNPLYFLFVETTVRWTTFNIPSLRV